MENYSTPPELDPVDLWYKSGKTQQELAKMMGVHTTTFARWCNGTRKATPPHRRLAAELAQQLIISQ